MSPLRRHDLRLSEAPAGRVDGLARGPVVTRTHRVIRERARVLEERRSRVRSLLLPLLISSVLLGLTVLAVWTGLYQYQAVEAVGADVAALAETSNHLAVVIFWFVPVSLAVLFAVWMRRSRNGSENEIR